jgi:hypothetical protein
LRLFKNKGVISGRQKVSEIGKESLNSDGRSTVPIISKTNKQTQRKKYKCENITEIVYQKTKSEMYTDATF